MKYALIFCGALSFFLFQSTQTYADNFPKKNSPMPHIVCPEGTIGCVTRRFTVSKPYQESQLTAHVVPRVLNWMVITTAALAVLMGVVAGVMFLFAGADEELLGKAKSTITYAIVGLLLAMFAYFIVELINRLPFPGAPGS